MGIWVEFGMENGILGDQNGGKWWLNGLTMKNGGVSCESSGVA